jgi:endonuclease VIII
MPEGDTIFRAARTLQHALAGQQITRFETGLAQLAQVNRDQPIAGTTIERVEAMGKHLLMTLSNGLVLRTHMRMNGSWHIYRPGERWQAPRHAMRIAIETAAWVAVAFDVYDAELVRDADRHRHPRLAALGPDLLGAFDADQALARVRRAGATPIHEVLLDQRVMAGIGNVYKSELLFLSRLHPDTPADAVDDDAWRTVMALAGELLRANVHEASGGGVVTYRGMRRTTGRMNPTERLWVYGRGGRPCRVCGSAIDSRKDGDDARITYWCARCQTPGDPRLRRS